MTVRPVRALLSCSTSDMLRSKDKRFYSKLRWIRDSSTLWASKYKLETVQGFTTGSYRVLLPAPTLFLGDSQSNQLTHVFCCRTDRVTSVAIPVALSCVGGFLLGKGLYHMYTGTGKLE